MSSARNGFKVTNAAVTATDGTDVVGTVKLDPSQRGYVTFTIANTDADGSVALNSFDLQVQTHPNASFVTILSDAGFDTAGEVAKWSTTNIHTCADEAEESAGVFVGAVHAIRFLTGVASGGVSVTVSGSVY